MFILLCYFCIYYVFNTVDPYVNVMILFINTVCTVHVIIHTARGMNNNIIVIVQILVAT